MNDDRRKQLTKKLLSYDYIETNEDEEELRVNETSPYSSPTKKETVKKPEYKISVDEQAMDRYSLVLKKRVLWTFILLLLMLMERIFSKYFRDYENKFIEELQIYFDIRPNSNTRWYLGPITFLEDTRNFALVVSHFYVSIYFLEGTITALKIMIVHLNALAFISIFEIVFGDPRPYWTFDGVVAIDCPNSFSFPSYSAFALLFLFIYGLYAIFQDEADEDWSIPELIAIWAFIIFFIVFAVCKVLAGFDYITQTLLASVYALMVYYPLTIVDKGLTQMVEKTSIDIHTAKRYTQYWFFYLLLLVGAAGVCYTSADPYMNITWYKNYYDCLIGKHRIENISNIDYQHILGAWGSFTKTALLFTLVGALFGAAKTIRDFKGVLWYGTNDWNKRKMFLIANLCIIPSWLLKFYAPHFNELFGTENANIYLFTCTHYILLFYFQFGVLPYHVFRRWGWTKKDDLVSPTTKSLFRISYLEDENKWIESLSEVY